MMVEESLRHGEKSDSQGTIVFTVERQEIKHDAMELTLGMVKKENECPTNSKNLQSLQAYSLHISFQEHR